MARPDALDTFTHDLFQKLEAAPPRRRDIPFYDYRSAADRDILISESTPHALHLGTGASIYTCAILPAILEAKNEILLVTCFWAKSRTLDSLRQCLETLAAHRMRLIEQASAPPSTPPPATLRIRICLSSHSLFQKLFHGWSRHGHVYPPSSWVSTFGLPDEAILRAASVDLQIKSIFLLPFSVMHPKFVIIDRQKAILPSCNVSWEAWLEGCIQVSGHVVASLVDFYSRTWDPRNDFTGTNDIGHTWARRVSGAVVEPGPLPPPAIVSSASVFIALDKIGTVPTLLLPSSNHRWPRFRLWGVPRPPPTPLNTALLRLFYIAKSSIFIQTPDLTSPVVMWHLLAAQERGCDVEIVTSRDMKVHEQLLTAMTTTSRCVRQLVKLYEDSASARGSVDGVGAHAADRLVGGGRLRISYFRSLRQPASHRQPDDTDEEAAIGAGADSTEEPVHTHFKVTIVDGRYTVLGSGNMDRASWYTSQELGILFDDVSLATETRAAIARVLEGRLDSIFDSAADSPRI